MLVNTYVGLVTKIQMVSISLTEEHDHYRLGYSIQYPNRYI